MSYLGIPFIDDFLRFLWSFSPLAILIWIVLIVLTILSFKAKSKV